MGNTLSVTVRDKVRNNGKIWNQTLRNSATASAIGLFLTILKYRKWAIYFYNSHDQQDDKDRQEYIEKYAASHHLLLVSIFKFFIKFPLFVAVFSITFKKMMRMNYISHALDIDMDTLPKQKYSITLMSFLLAYYMQSNVSVFSYKWALLLLIRALYGLLRLH